MLQAMTPARDHRVICAGRNSSRPPQPLSLAAWIVPSLVQATLSNILALELAPVATPPAVEQPTSADGGTPSPYAPQPTTPRDAARPARTDLQMYVQAGLAIPFG